MPFARGEKIKGGLLLDSRHGVLKGGEFGPALVPGKPEESLLLKAISYSDPDLEMPPKQKLDPVLVDHVREWIALGAPDPREGTDMGGRTVTARKGPNAADLWSLCRSTRRRCPRCGAPTGRLAQWIALFSPRRKRKDSRPQVMPPRISFYGGCTMC